MFGIDIGYKNIKVAEVVENKGKLEIRRLLKVGVPSEAYDNLSEHDNMINAKILVETLKKVKQEIGMVKSINYVFCNHQVITRDMDVNAASKAAMEDAILESINQSLPGIVDTSIIDYRQKKDGKIMTCAAPEALVELYCQAMYDAGFKINAVDIECNSLRKFIVNYVNKNEAIGIIDIGHMKIDVSVFFNGELEINRTFQFGSSRIDELIANFYNISTEDAEKIKVSNFKDHDLSEEDKQRYFRFGYEEIAEEIKRMFQFFNSKSRETRIQKAILIGGGSLMSGTEEFFQNILEVPVSVFTLGQDVVLRLKGEFNIKELPIYIPAISAVLREDNKNERH